MDQLEKRRAQLSIVLDAFEQTWPYLAHNIEAMRKEVRNDEVVAGVLLTALDAMGCRDAGLLPEPRYMDH